MKSLKIRKKNSRNYIIYLDELPQGELPVGKLRSLSLFGNLFHDNEIDADQQQIVEVVSEIANYTWQRLLNWLALQERSIKECRLYLQKLSLSEEISNDILEKAQRYNYINDERFAELYINSLRENGKSYIEIKAKLHSKIEDMDQIEYWLQQHYDQQQQKETLKSNIEKLSSRWSGLEKKQRLQKMINYLTRRGFNYYEIKDALASQDEEYENDYS